MDPTHPRTSFLVNVRHMFDLRDVMDDMSLVRGRGRRTCLRDVMDDMSLVRGRGRRTCLRDVMDDMSLVRGGEDLPTHVRDLCPPTDLPNNRPALLP